MQSKALAVLLCGLSNLFVFALFLFIESAGFTRIVYGLPLSEMSFAAPFNSLWRLTAIVGIVFALFLGMDIFSISRGMKFYYGLRPNLYPVDYALLRLRRYMLLPLGFAYFAFAVRFLALYNPAGIANTFRPEPDSLVNFTFWSLVVFVAGFFVTRRPLAWDYWTLFDEIRKFVEARWSEVATGQR